MKNRLKCFCGAKIKVQTIPDFPGSKSGHISYTHIPGPPCSDFYKALEATNKKTGSKTVQKP